MGFSLLTPILTSRCRKQTWNNKQMIIYKAMKILVFLWILSFVILAKALNLTYPSYFQQDCEVSFWSAEHFIQKVGDYFNLLVEVTSTSKYNGTIPIPIGTNNCDVEIYRNKVRNRGLVIIIWTGLNIKIGIAQNV